MNTRAYIHPSTGTPSILETGDALAQVRDDLAEAQRSRALLEARLHTMTDEDQKLKMQSSLDVKQIAELTKAKAALSTSVKDRDEELRGKAKLLEVCSPSATSVSGHNTGLSDGQDIHDETVSLTLQLNMAEDQSRELRQENKQLVDRWMKRMGQEAEALNISSKFS